MNNLYLFAIVSIMFSVILTPFIKKLAVKLDIMDVPKDNRRIHNKPIHL